MKFKNLIVPFCYLLTVDNEFPESFEFHLGNIQVQPFDGDMRLNELSEQVHGFEDVQAAAKDVDRLDKEICTTDRHGQIPK